MTAHSWEVAPPTGPRKYKSKPTPRRGICFLPLVSLPFHWSMSPQIPSNDKSLAVHYGKVPHRISKWDQVRESRYWSLGYMHLLTNAEY